MTPQELKNSILQLAIQGKLVEQRPEEGTAAELLEKILATKNAKSAKKDLTRSRGARGAGEGMRGLSHLPKAAFTLHGTHSATSASPREKIPDDEIPFEIPESWEWVRIWEVFNLQAGKNIKSEEIHQEYSSEHKYKCYGGNGCRGYVADYNRTGHHVLIGRQGALCGNINYAEGDFYATEHAVVVEQFAGTDVYWCGYFLDALNLNRYATATAQPGLAVAKINQVPIPLPPLAEQKRIVAKIEELLPLIDRYEKAWSKLEDFNKRFPVDMQKSLLQMAIQGKLVEQRPEEGTAAELLEKILAAKNAKGNLTRSRGARGENKTSAPSASPREKIPDDEKPFDIPDSWVWCLVGDLFNHNTGKAMNSSAKATHKSGKVRKFITTSNVYWNSFDLTSLKEMFFSDDELERCSAKKNDILMCEGGAYYGRAAIWKNDYDICFQNHIHRLRPHVPICEEFFYYVFFFYRNNGMMKPKGTAMPGLSSIVLHNLLIPLPPLAEQKRIVTKLEELLPLCERLK